MTNTIPADLINALPHGVSLEDCTITTVAALDADHDVDIVVVDNAPAIVLPGWFADDGNAEVYYQNAESGKDAASEYVESGDWGDELNRTDWVDVWAWRRALVLDEDGQVITIEMERDRHTIALDPEEPPCTHDEHDWRERDVRGHGGGVIITDICAHCGCYRIHDTWAQRSDTGEQGLKSVEYRDADEASRLAAAEDKLVGSDTRVSCGKLYVRRGELTDDAADRATDDIRELLGEGYDVSWYRDDDEIIVVVEVE